EHRDDLAFGNVEIEVFVQRPTREVLGEAADGDVRAGRAGLERGHRDIREYGRIQYGIHLPLQWMILRSMSRNNTLSAYPSAPAARMDAYMSFTFITCCELMIRLPRPLSAPMNISATITITSAIETAERRPTKLGCRLSQTSTSLNTCQREAPITLAAITRCLRAFITP